MYTRDTTLASLSKKIGLSIPTLNKLFKFYRINKRTKSESARLFLTGTNAKGNPNNPFLDPVVQQRIKEGWKDKGVSNPSQLADVIEKKRLSAQRKYGVDSVLQSPEIKKKIVATLNLRYGVDNPSQNESIKRKREATCLSRYGVDNPRKSKKVIDKIAQTNLILHGGTGLSSPKTRDKIHATNILIYGNSNPATTDRVKSKIQNSFLYRDFVFPSGRVERVQGYESIFLHYLLNSGIEENRVCVRPLTIKYLHPFGSVRKYTPDSSVVYADRTVFYEVKSAYYLYRYFAENIAKAKAMLNSEYDFRFVIVSEKRTVRLLTYEEALTEDWSRVKRHG